VGAVFIALVVFRVVVRVFFLIGIVVPVVFFVGGGGFGFSVGLTVGEAKF
jgi:hypothetical protein